MYIKEQKFLVVGASKSGVAVANYLLGKCKECYVFEELQTENIVNTLKTLTEKGAIVITTISEEVLSNIDVVILSPGVPINHEIAVLSKKLGKRIMGELEFSLLRFNPPLVAITGTNGKTTTVSLIDNILKEARLEYEVVGNIGIPLASKIESSTKNTLLVAEVSSFQLETLNHLLPHITCILNISPDHLERHYTMENYVFLKKKIFKNQQCDDFAVLNYDDDLVREFKEEINSKIIWVSLKESVKGAYLKEGKLYYFNEYIMDVENLALIGEHNVYNSLFAIAVCKILGINNEVIVSALKTFKGVKHRIELVAEKNGKKYFNDSKSTNTASSIVALSAMQAPTVLILGGSEKGENYDNLFEKIKLSEIKHVVLTGASRLNMLNCATKHGVNNVTVTESFSVAVNVANMVAKEGENVLLSPACASFDKFSGYEERGEEFIKLVGELQS
ncbi:MAG: UDP-N-acetylmuramoyl-L-alanine--D-glutamate ligase [Clostridia bacterium]|nr:UDP-N-acetylmuramoyl-L-alanine--D-glutamate ligase [Clostridia bacterium]